MQDRNHLQRDVLYAVAGHGAPNGLEVKTVLDDYYGKVLQHAQIYPALNSLVAEGLLEKRAVDGRTNAYSMTEGGRQLLANRRRWENALVDLPTRVRRRPRV